MHPKHLALWRTGDEDLFIYQKYKLVSKERCRLLPLVPHCFPRARRSMPRSHILFLIRWNGVDWDSRSSRASLILFFRFSILAKNLCQPTCWHVFKRGGRASSRGKRRSESRRGRLGSRVTGMQCRISRCPGWRGEGRETYTSKCSGT